MKNQLSFLVVVSSLWLHACSAVPNASTGTAVAPAAPEAALSGIALKPSDWSALTGWADDDVVPAWDAFLKSCGVLKNQLLWRETCTQADAMRGENVAALRQFFESRFIPHQVLNPDGSGDGLITGYYEPLLRGSRTRSSKYRYPLYTTPDELLIIDLSTVYPELKNMRLRGRLQGRKVVPYYTRREIESDPERLQGKELFWVDDAVDLFFLQVQGSGRIRLENDETVRVGYAEQNGHPYKSIGRLLVERGELSVVEASMQGIRAWGERNPSKLGALLRENASFVFFRELPSGSPGPLGSLGVPLTAGRSLAVDTRVIPQGAPVFLATTWPATDRQLSRLMVAQDTGGAIKGNVRADFFWGFGAEAGDQAGKMRQQGKLWVLMPMDYAPDIRTPQAIQGQQAQ